MTKLDAATKQILDNIKYQGKESMMIETADRVFILDFVSKYSVSGYVCGIIGDYRSGYKQVHIQKTKNGKRYIMADRVRFNADEIKPCTIAREAVEKELALTISMRETILNIQQEGNDIGYALKNQDYCIKNLEDYLRG